MNTAINAAVLLNSVSDNFASAVRTMRRQGVDRALEAVEGVMLTFDHNLKRLVVFVLANFACSHT